MGKWKPTAQTRTKTHHRFPGQNCKSFSKWSFMIWGTQKSRVPRHCAIDTRQVTGGGFYAMPLRLAAHEHVGTAMAAIRKPTYRQALQSGSEQRPHLALHELVKLRDCFVQCVPHARVVGQHQARDAVLRRQVRRYPRRHHLLDMTPNSIPELTDRKITDCRDQAPGTRNGADSCTGRPPCSCRV